MKDIDSLGKRRDIHHAKSAGCDTNANFAHARADTLDRFPIKRIEAILNPPELEACLLSSRWRKVANSSPRISQEDDELHYIKTDIDDKSDLEPLRLDVW